MLNAVFKNTYRKKIIHIMFVCDFPDMGTHTTVKLIYREHPRDQQKVILIHR